MGTQVKRTTPDISTLSNGEVINLGSIAEQNVTAIYPGTGLVNEDSTWEFVESVDGVFWEALTGGNFTGENGTNGIARMTVKCPFIGLKLGLKNTETAGVIDVEIVGK